MFWDNWSQTQKIAAVVIVLVVLLVVVMSVGGTSGFESFSMHELAPSKNKLYGVLPLSDHLLTSHA